jgi:hypothetical protein
MKKPLLIMIVVIILIGALATIIRFGLGGDEDNWICSSGAWVKHGNPSAPMPTVGCGSTNTTTKPACETITNETVCQDRTDCLPVDSCACTTGQVETFRCGIKETPICGCTTTGFVRCEALDCDNLSNTNSAINTNSSITKLNTNSVHIENDFKTKIVYTTRSQSELEIAVMENDCRERKGTFNTCGSPCDLIAEVCIDVCAYTCDRIPQ